MKKKKSISLSTSDVIHYAKLAHLPLEPDQAGLFKNQLTETLSYVQQLDTVTTSGVEPTAQVTGLTNVFREDIVIPGLTQKEALQNAPSTYKGFFKVPSVFEE
ncbi:MAG: Aspartyl/glutamyl-tRNA(Asn/Gln) amidotransferase subunit C [Candidatus Gottesmanbacteria bacterium GW2011_GWA2_44_17]|uniref:Aspartyl/glutamyl-tRNA(Asn/Gln) amidotransferase subunit C n=3 Tax=Candidatus Gottesmaniibacteriota TaxID=1752720 RepID=A0A0G1KXU8_9BACT|nr:MAG: Glutamyl-tRNA(Gln) amidotransferase subunit C [Microgenomates group bacterium GW2011_GWC1_43_11]KKT36639.1 MAG: Aspartyl/glutamyl-tRNA(Asn/Gln) amidotransferase subunit C [Candidatus Gottesmanbacteria bacterium GW2011_GWB1_44_11c]KKT47407.1 MAG: Aspartyl/glutamyl-tRNA(Asn/Gln) amidotransferase subunit C [Candidatus Gottesmanbacteria bacterium GW2011_GWA2_44_17]KKT61112.1 MAG: Aspartyl/glutamyl-tRNA(Asn/Gln) amidotransferase subunit C [Candidatus Gottesmanbacteria bacterium GW2011_GWA1_44